MSSEPMALKVVNKINGKLKFLFRKNKFVTLELRRMLCNVLIQPHLTTRSQLGTHILPKKQKRRYQLCKINVYAFVLD